MRVLYLQIPASASLTVQEDAHKDEDSDDAAPTEFVEKRASRPQTKSSGAFTRPTTTHSGVTNVSASGVAGIPEAEMPRRLCNHLAEALDSVPSYKFFVFGGQTCGGSEKEALSWRYCSNIDIMDCSSRTWIDADITGPHAPGDREDAAWAYDPKTGNTQKGFERLMKTMFLDR